VSEYLDVYDWLEALWALSLAVQIEGGKDYDLRDLENLLRWDRPDHAMTGRVKDGFRFLARMSDLEGELTKDKARRSMAEIEQPQGGGAKAHRLKPEFGETILEILIEIQWCSRQSWDTPTC
jgi:hypothetical protein